MLDVTSVIQLSFTLTFTSENITGGGRGDAVALPLEMVVEEQGMTLSHLVVVEAQEVITAHSCHIWTAFP